MAGGRPLRVGLLLPCMAELPDGSPVRWADILALARVAEDVGFDSLWTFDELLWRFEQREPLGFWECWTTLSAVASATSRIELGTLITCASYRNPGLIAKMAVTVDEISGGRLVLGLGAGWSEEQFRMFGYPFEHHAGRFEEALRVVHGLLREGRVEFDGSYCRAQADVFLPTGPRPGGIPIVVGGGGPRMMRLAARYGDGWNGWVPSKSRVEVVPPLRAKLDRACAEAGRDPATLERSLGLGVALGNARMAYGEMDWTPGMITGSPDEIARTLRTFAAEGIDHVQLVVVPCTVSGVEAIAPVLDRLDRGA